MRARIIISEAEALAWRHRKGHVWRHMTEAEAEAWDRAQAEGDRATLIAIKKHCHGDLVGVYVSEIAPR